MLTTFKCFDAFVFHSNKRGQLKTSYKSDYVTANLDVDSVGGPTVRAAAVAGLVLTLLGSCHF